MTAAIVTVIVTDTPTAPGPYALSVYAHRLF